MRLIDADAFFQTEKLLECNTIMNCKESEFLFSQFMFDIQNFETIDPETLPIVQELREQLEQEKNKKVKIKYDDSIMTIKEICDRLKNAEQQLSKVKNALNGALAFENFALCPKCGDALTIDIVNGVLSIGCFGCNEYTPVSELMRLYTDDVVPIPTVAQWLGRDDFCSNGERKESNE